ncbi:MAG: HAD family phosphatase [Abitibacteriaceae bacterium]|nr:HAD family phosphatase [Abditibacteriaceae bacterium]
MKSPLRVAVFDIGDVLFTPHAQSDFLNRWEQRLGIARGELSQLLWYGPDIEAANIGRITAEEYCRRCAPRLGCNAALALALVEDAFSGARLNDELVRYIQTLKPQMQIVALTNNWSFGRRLLEKRGITALLDLIITSAEEGVRKPQSRLYEIMLQRLAIAPAAAVFVDDDAENVAAARTLGIHSIHFHSTQQAIAELNELLSGQHSQVPQQVIGGNP